MARRLQLQLLLEGILGSRNVYFQPPNNLQMVYPCIVYKKDAERARFAGNAPYRRTNRYQVTYIDQDPDSLVPDQIGELPMCKFDRHFTANNLNHSVYNLYF